jgi:hypothetical protein
MAERKSNRQLTLEIGRLTGKAEPNPVVFTVKRALGGGGRGTVWLGVRSLHDLMTREGAFFVSPGCAVLRSSLSLWQGADDGNKHIIDALRYACTSYIRAYDQGASQVQFSVRLRGRR